MIGLASIVIILLVAIVAVLWLLPLVSELTSVLVVANQRHRDMRDVRQGSAARVRLLILVPAHNEALLIDSCIRSLRSMQAEKVEFDLCVVADNCIDDTSRIAESAGARVLIRNDDSCIGKPHAVGWALTQLSLDSYDALVIIDADTVVEPTFAERLAARAPLGNKAVQARFSVRNEDQSWLTRLAALFVAIRYDGQYALKQRAGLNSVLSGNGMCIGVSLLARTGWVPNGLTENWELYARCVINGEHIDLALDATLRAQEAHTLIASTTQRQRWQAGRWHVLCSYGWRILRSRHASIHQKIDAIGELAAPGPVFHAGSVAAGVAALALIPGAAARSVALALMVSLLPMAVWTLAAWIDHPRPAQLGTALARLPLYGVWRLFVGIGALQRRNSVWRRSPRYPDSSTSKTA